MAFHEKAGRRQVRFFLPFLSPPSFLAERCSEPSRARSLLRQRTLHGEDRSSTIPLGRKAETLCIFGLPSVLSAHPNQRCRHPSLRTLHRATSSLGASWVFSFQPVLETEVDNQVASRDGSWARPLTQCVIRPAGPPTSHPEVFLGARHPRFGQ
jgi:hypothetical protein